MSIWDSEASRYARHPYHDTSCYRNLSNLQQTVNQTQASSRLLLQLEDSSHEEERILNMKRKARKVSLQICYPINEGIVAGTTAGSPDKLGHLMRK